MTDPANPLGLNGFEFVEYAHPEPDRLKALFARLGFSEVARHLPSSPSRRIASAKDRFGVPNTLHTSATPSSGSDTWTLRTR